MLMQRGNKGKCQSRNASVHAAQSPKLPQPEQMQDYTKPQHADQGHAAEPSTIPFYYQSSTLRLNSCRSDSVPLLRILSQFSEKSFEVSRTFKHIATQLPAHIFFFSPTRNTFPLM